MRILSVTLFFLSVYLQSSAQTLRGTVNEGQTLTMTAPAGKVFISVTFASYGTPTGSCGSYSTSSCHAANSLTIVQTALIGNNSANIPATNGVFGDPCGGTFKRLYVEAVYSFPLPLKLLSFRGETGGSTNFLKWETTDEVNTDHFKIERSDDGIHFANIGFVSARNQPGNNLYSYADRDLQSKIHFYRLKMIDKDSKFSYSKTIRVVNNNNRQIRIIYAPGNLIIKGTNAGSVVSVIDLEGKIMLKVNSNSDSQTIPINNLAAGIYFVKSIYKNEISIQKFVKQ